MKTNFKDEERKRKKMNKTLFTLFFIPSKIRKIIIFAPVMLVN